MQTSTRKTTLAQTTAWAVFNAALAVGGLASPAFAQQQPAASDSDEPNEIVVTAQRREQVLQDVPIAVSAFTGDRLEESGVRDVNDLQLITPSLFVNSTGSAASDTTLRIRGVGTTGNNAGLEGAVGVFVDNVYRNRSGMALGQLVDVQRVEVLRGPQSTLFGKNTTAGALSIITNAPELGEFHAGGTMNFGDPDVLGGNFHINVPVGDALAFRITGAAEGREGFITNRNTGVDNQDLARGFVRAQALLDLGPDANLRVIGDYSEVSNNGNTGVRARHAGARSVTVNTIEANHGRSLTGVGHFDSNSLNTDPNNNAQDWGISAELNWDILPSITLTNTLAYRDYDRRTSGDSDFTGADILNADATEGYTTISDELRFTGESGPFQWLAGAFYDREDIDAFTRLEFGTDAGSFLCGLFTGNLNPACFNATGSQPVSVNTTFIGDNNFNPNQVIAGEGSSGTFTTRATSWSVFAQGTWHFTEQLSATLGARYIDDRKDGTGVNVVDNTVAVSDNNSLPPFLGRVRDFDQSIHDNVVTGTANIQYEWTPDFMTYASYSRGYKAGGFNLDRTAATNITPLTGNQPVRTAAFLPELSDSYELGLKSQWFGDHVGLNLTAFYTDFEDLQILSFTGLAFIVENMPNARSRGVELEAYVSPIRNLTLNTGVTFAETRYGEGALLSQSAPNPPINLEGRHFTNAPVWSASAGIGYNFPVGDTLDVYLRTDYFYGSGRTTSSAQGPDKFQDGYGLLNARVGLMHDSGWDLSLWCRNCADTEYYTVLFNSVFQNSATSPNVDGYIGNRREMGVALSVDF